MENVQQDIHYSDTVTERNGKIYRYVTDIKEAEKILSILNNIGITGVNAVRTGIYSYNDNLLEHEKLNGIIHSEEYTESMAYDVSELAIIFSIKLLKDKIYGWDMLPHNFTFNKSKWVLYDFGALSLKPDNLKTEIRGFFKIVFPAFELTKIVSRNKLGELFLNRIKISDLLTILPIKNWFKLFLELNISMFLLYTKQYEKLYNMLYLICKRYEKQRKIYYLELNSNDLYLSGKINQLITNYNIEKIFIAGESAAKLALSDFKQFDKIIYIDDYELCDEIYNYIVQNRINNTSIGRLFPLEDNDKISNNITEYRAIYDNYAKKRFNCDCAIFLENNIDENFIKNLSDFANKLLIVKADEKYIELLNKIYNDTQFININSETILIAVNKKEPFQYNKTEKSYKNFNRGCKAEIQTKEIKEIIKNNL